MATREGSSSPRAKKRQLSLGEAGLRHQKIRRSTESSDSCESTDTTTASDTTTPSVRATTGGSDLAREGVCLRDGDDYFMAVALLSAERSKDPDRQVGACLVDASGKVVGTGYNGLPDACSDDDFPWTKEKCNPDSEIKHVYVCHAEINALLNRNVKSVERCTLYCNFSPCWDCAREMLQVGIKKVVYGNTYDTEALKRIKKVTGTDGRPRMEVAEYNPEKGITISIDLNSEKLQCEEQSETCPDEPKNKPPPAVTKRKVHLKWDDYFMAMACLASTRRGILKGKPANGVYIVNDRKRFVGIGHDCIIQGTVPENQDEYNVCHATAKGILDCSSPDLRGCTLYTLYFPCNKCALMIIQSGMTKFIYYDDDICPCYEGFHTKEEKKGDEQREKGRASKKLLDHAGVFYKKYGCGLPAAEDMEKYKQNKFSLDKLKKTEIQICLNHKRVCMFHDHTIECAMELT